jgi:formate dehydrogenase subunit delta
MDTPYLIKQANRIAEFFQALSDPQEACDGVAQHIKKFWEPRMRRGLLHAVDEKSANDLHPLVELALTRHRAMLDPDAT